MDRRRFLQGAAAATLTLGAGLRLAAPSAGAACTQLRHLSVNQGRILSACYRAITSDPSGAPLCDIADAPIGLIDELVGSLSGRDRFELSAGLVLLEQSPLFLCGHWRRFTALTLEQQRDCLNAWRFGPRMGRPLFTAVKELCYLAHYTAPAHWESIGYRGPLVSGDGIATALDAPYLALLAPGEPR